LIVLVDRCRNAVARAATAYWFGFACDRIGRVVCHHLLAPLRTPLFSGLGLEITGRDLSCFAGVRSDRHEHHGNP